MTSSKSAQATAKQAEFARLVVEGYTPVESYIQAYDADGMKGNSIRVEASKLLRNQKVHAIVEKGRREALSASAFKRADAIDRLNRANSKALERIESGTVDAATVNLFNSTFESLLEMTREAYKAERSKFQLYIDHMAAYDDTPSANIVTWLD